MIQTVVILTIKHKNASQMLIRKTSSFQMRMDEADLAVKKELSLK